MTGRTITNVSKSGSSTSSLSPVESKHHRRVSSGGLRLRSNLIHKLGIAPSKSKAVTSESVSDSPKHVRSILGSNPNIVIEQLNDHDEFHGSQDDGFWNFGKFLLSLPVFGNNNNNNNNSSRSAGEAFNNEQQQQQLSSSLSTQTSSLSNSTRSETGSEKRLKFNEDVEVCSIPRREQYSKRIRQQLWPDLAEFSKKAEQNTLEFASEGWDWRNTLDKEDMYFDVTTGEYIHPIHIIIEQQHQQREQEQEHKQVDYSSEEEL